MDKRAFLWKYGLALSTAVVAVLLMAASPLTSTQSASGSPSGSTGNAADLGTALAVASYNGQSGYELPLGPETYIYLPIIARNDLNTTFFIRNTVGWDAVIVVEFYTSDGVRAHVLSDVIPPHGSLSYEQAAMEDLPAGFEGGVVIFSDQPVLAVANVRPSDTDSLLSYNGAQAGATEVVLPLIMRNCYGHNTDFWVQNAGMGSANVTMTYVPTTAGNSYIATDVISSGASRVYRQVDILELGDSFAGWVSVTADQPVVVVAEIWNLAKDEAAAYNGIADADSSVLEPRQQKEVDGWSSSTLIMNVGTDVTEIVADLYASDGSHVWDAMSAVSPGEPVTYYFPFDPGIPDGFDGALEVAADQPLAMLVNWSNPSLTGDGLAMNRGIDRSRLTGQMHLPRVAHVVAEGVSTRFSNQNAGEVAATVTISYYHESGVATAVMTDAIPPHGVSRYATEDVGALREDWEGSVTISADQPIAVEAVQFLSQRPVTPAAYLPLIIRHWPPVPETPVLHDINNPDGDGNYMVSWSPAARAVSYILQEDRDSSFPNPVVMYSGPGTSTTVTGRGPGTYYYRVKATNSWGDSGWSQVKSVTVGVARLQAEADTFVASASDVKDENFGDWDEMYVGYDKVYEYEKERCLVRFDLSSIPSNATINSATLRLYLYSYVFPTGGSTTMNVKTYRIKDAWSEYDVTWSNQPARGESYGSASVGTEFTWYSFDVTNLVRKWASGSEPNYGIMLRGDESEGYHERSFDTREGWYEPELVIDYMVPDHIPTTSSVSPLTRYPVPTARCNSGASSGGRPLIWSAGARITCTEQVNWIWR